MNPAYGRSRARRLSVLLHRWHRRIGIFISVFVIWMAVSGWLLNHTAALALAQHSITVPLIVERYGLHAEMPARAFNSGAHWLTFTAESTWLDGKKLSIPLSQPLGLAEDERALYTANANVLLLFDKSGALIDSESTDLLPIKKIARLGIGCGGVAIADDETVYASTDAVTWQRCDSAVRWSDTQSLSEQQRAIVKPLVQPGVSLEKFIQDLHSGRFFGALGPFFVDAIGLLFVALALSGLWMFAHQRKQRALRR